MSAPVVTVTLSMDEAFMLDLAARVLQNHPTLGPTFARMYGEESVVSLALGATALNEAMARSPHAASFLAAKRAQQDALSEAAG